MADHLTPSERALLQAATEATPGEWEWWNGCSWWRLGVANRDRTCVIEPTCDSDGHPNLIVRAEDRRYIEAAQPRAVLALLDEIERLRGALRILTLDARPANWNDGDDPCAEHAWRQADAALNPKKEATDA